MGAFKEPPGQHDQSGGELREGWWQQGGDSVCGVKSPVWPRAESRQGWGWGWRGSRGVRRVLLGACQEGGGGRSREPPGLSKPQRLRRAWSVNV